ncbi:hypothetical protein SAMN04487761_10383 [Lachnospiraceae bacterium C7]|nr:hypothetical protein SAMN04487761_10383 [Lachnospiraceae bacterium C7]
MQLPFRGSGVVNYSNKEYKCALYYSDNGGGIVLKIMQLTETGFGDFFELPLEIKELSARLDTGYEFTLIDLIREKTNDNLSTRVSEYTYYAKYLFSGVNKKFSEKSTFSKIDFELEDIVEWGEDSIYYVGENYELISKDEPVSRIIYSGDDYTIKYKVVGSYLPIVDHELLKEKIELLQHGLIEINFPEEHELNDFLEVFSKVKSLFEIALLSKVHVNRIYGFSNKILEYYGDKSVERKINIYGEIITEKSYDSKRPVRFNWITLSDFIENKSFDAYIKKHDRLAPIIELYIELFYLQGKTNVRVFLNIVQALETYHSRFVTNDLKMYKSRISSLVQKAPTLNADYIKRNLMANSKRFITLESRLADLLYAEGNIYFDTGEIKHEDFPSVIAHTRNYYIHYDEKIKDKYKVFTSDELKIYNSVLFEMLEYYILYELGFNIESRGKLVTTRWG